MRCGTWAPGPVCVWIGQRGRLRLPARGKIKVQALEILTRLKGQGCAAGNDADSIRHGGIEIKHSMRHTSHVMRISTFNRTFVKSSNRS